DHLGEPRLRVLLLRVLQVAGEPDVRVLGDRGEPLAERRPRLLHHPMRELELPAVGRADRVGAGADRSTRCRERALASLHARVETPSEIVGDAVQIHGTGVQTRAASTSAAGLTTMFTRSSPNAGRPLNDRRAVRFEASAAYRCRVGRGLARAGAAVSRGGAGSAASAPPSI